MPSAPYRSDKVLRHAKGQPCTLRFPGICDGGGATTVACHIRDKHKGMAVKASDHSIAFGCGPCHAFLDVGFANAGWTTDDLAPFEKRALQETWEVLIGDGIIVFPHNLVTPSHAKPTPPRKPKEKRAPIHSRGFPEQSRPLRSRNNLRKERV